MCEIETIRVDVNDFTGYGLEKWRLISLRGIMSKLDAGPLSPLSSGYQNYFPGGVVSPSVAKIDNVQNCTDSEHGVQVQNRLYFFMSYNC